MFVVVTGGRDFYEWRKLWRELHKLRGEIDVLLVGDADGADAAARHWAHAHKVNHLTAYADWDAYGPPAGPRRNGALISYARALAPSDSHIVVIAAPGGKGTADCVRQARAAGLYVKEIT